MTRRPGFTRLEVVVVVCITAILAALLLPVTQKLREASNRTRCIHNLQKIGAACHAYHDAKRRLPPGGSHTSPATAASLEAEQREAEWSWAYHLLPFLGHADTHGNPNAAVVQATAIPSYYCPSRRSPRCHNNRALLDYAGNAGTLESGANGTIMRTTEGRISFSDITDGIASTVLIGEKRMNAAALGECLGDREGYAAPGWTPRFEAHRLGSASPAADVHAPGDDAAFAEFGSSHIGAINALFADGSVRSIRFTISPATWRRACIRNDNESFNLNDL